MSEKMKWITSSVIVLGSLSLLSLIVWFFPYITFFIFVFILICCVLLFIIFCVKVLFFDGD